MVEISRILPSDITAKPIAKGLAYWLSRRRADGSLPGRRDIDPTDIPSVLPYVEITEVINGGEDFRLRLVGTHLVDVDGVNPTGQTLSSFFKVPSYRDYQMGLYRHVVDHGIPLYSRSVMPIVDINSMFRTERLYCPLAADGRTVDTIINFQVCRGLEPGTVTLEMAYDPYLAKGLVAEVDLRSDEAT